MRWKTLRWMLTSVGGLIAATTCAASAPAELPLERFPTPVMNAGFQSAGADVRAVPDGGVMRLLFDAGIQRIDRFGVSASAELPSGMHPNQGTLTLLQDGTSAFLAYRFEPQVTADEFFVSVPWRGATMRVTPLPRALGDVYKHPTAIAPDGSVWQSRRCGNMLVRWRPGGAVTRTTVADQQCRRFVWREPGHFAFAGDGTTWLLQPCLARIVRVPLVGEARTWALPPRRRCNAENELSQQHPWLRPTTDGGLQFVNGRIDRRGHLHATRETPADALAPDGAEWRRRPQVFVRRSPDGRLRRFSASPDGRRYIAASMGPDGRLWYLRARLGDGLSAGYYNYDFVLGAIDAAGRDESQPIEPYADLRPTLVPTGDGSIWLGAQDATYRLGLDQLMPGATRATVGGAVARRRATVWIQVTCSSSRPGKICGGVVTLRSAASVGELVRAQGRFAIPSGETRAIPLRIRPEVLRRLRAVGPQRVTAVVRSRGGVSHAKPVTLR
jgi:hypothetical protein